MSFSFESGGGGNWSTSYDFGDSLSFDIDFNSWQAELSDFDAIGNDPFGFDVDLGSLSHDVVAFNGVGATDVVTTGPVGSQGSTSYSSGTSSPTARDVGEITVIGSRERQLELQAQFAVANSITDALLDFQSGNPQIKSGAIYDAINLLETNGYGQGLNDRDRTDLENIVNQTPAYIAYVQQRQATLEQDIYNLSTDSTTYADRAIAAKTFLDSLSAEDRALLAGSQALSTAQQWADAVSIAPGGDSNFRRVPFTEESVRGIIELEQQADITAAENRGGFAGLAANIGTEGIASQYPSLFYYGDDGTRYFINGTPAGDLTLGDYAQLDRDIQSGSVNIRIDANAVAAPTSLGTGIADRIQAYGANPLELVEDVARLAIPGGGLIIDTAQNLIAGQDPVTAFVDAVQENIDRARNLAADAVGTVSDAALRIYEGVSDPIGSLADLGSTVIAAGETAATFVNGVRISNFSIDGTVAAIADSLDISDRIIQTAQNIAQATVDRLPTGAQKEVGDAYVIAVDTGNFGALNAVLAEYNLDRRAIDILFPQISDTAIDDLINRGLEFGTPAQDAAQLVANGNTNQTGGAATQSQTSTQSTVNAAVANSQNNSATLAANADQIATETANNTSAATQQAIVAAYESALQTGNFTTLNRILADNNLSQAAVQKLFPQLTQTEITDLAARGLVFGQPAADPVTGGTTVRTTNSANDVLNNIGGAIEDVDSAIRSGAGVINQVTNIINTAAAVPGIFVSAAAAAEQAAAAASNLIDAITAPPPVPQDLIPGVSAEALLLGNDPFGFDQDLLVNQNATIQLAQEQAALQARYNEPATPDWRVRLQLAPGAQYLYKDPSPGILAPLFNTDGVLFPYTPNIETSYAAVYDKYDLTHSNYRGYFYRNSAVNEVNIRGTFTAQDTQEANYLLAVIHFFRSVTKMFYGQDDLRGAPPPLVYLSGYGDFQFNEHPCLVSNFSYSLPSDVDYIRALAPNNYGTNLLNRRAATSGIALLSESVVRLTQVLPGASSLPTIPDPSNLNQSTSNTSSATYVPTKMEINVTLLPTNTRSQVSQQFSVKQFANGSLLKGGFW